MSENNKILFCSHCGREYGKEEFASGKELKCFDCTAPLSAFQPQEKPLVDPSHPATGRDTVKADKTRKPAISSDLANLFRENDSPQPEKIDDTAPGMLAQARRVFSDLSQIPLGTVIQGRLEILRLLGRGGMGAVYLVRDQVSGEERALKFLIAGEEGREIVIRFEREAKTARKVEHPNIIQIYGMGEYEDKLYIEMEYVPGESLGEKIDRRGALPVKEAVDYTLQAGRALALAHKKGIYHRDIKPDNIFISDDGQVKVGDFGLAKDLEVTAITQSGTAMGTPAYMSPEQLEGKELDATADIYSLGATLYHALVGRPPFEGEEHIEIYHKLLTQPVIFPREMRGVLPAELCRYIGKMMSKKPSQRPQNMEEVLFELEYGVS